MREREDKQLKAVLEASMLEGGGVCVGGCVCWGIGCGRERTGGIVSTNTLDTIHFRYQHFRYDTL